MNLYGKAADVAQHQRHGDRDDITIEVPRVRGERGVLDRDRKRGLDEQDRTGEAEASERRVIRSLDCSNDLDRVLPSDERERTVGADGDAVAARGLRSKP